MLLINKFLKDRRVENWKRRDYRTSIEYYYADILRKYNFDPMYLTIWYIDKENDYLQFGSNQIFYELRDGKINEINDDDVWIDKIRYDKKKKSSKKA